MTVGYIAKAESMRPRVLGISSQVSGFVVSA